MRIAALLRSALPTSALRAASDPPGPDAKNRSKAKHGAHQGKKCDDAHDHRYGYRQRADDNDEQICQWIAGRELSVFVALIHVVNSRLFGPAIEALKPLHPGLPAIV